MPIETVVTKDNPSVYQDLEVRFEPENFDKDFVQKVHLLFEIDVEVAV